MPKAEWPTPSTDPPILPDQVPVPDAILDALDCALVVVDLEDRIIRSNTQAGSWLGVPAASLVGKTRAEWAELVHGVFEAVAADPPTSDLPLSERLKTRRPPVRTFVRQARVFRDAQGAAAGYVEVLREGGEPSIGQRELDALKERHARELGALQMRLEHIEAFKMELTANVTHDLRTPLASIKASVSGLLAGDVKYDPQQLRETLSVIEEETDRLQRRVQNLLSMARMESGAADLSEDWVDLSDVVVSALEGLKALSGDRQIEVTFPEELPLVLGDYIQLQIAVRNLIENAFLYAPADKPLEINVSATMGGVRVRVRDYGQGLMPDEFERIFDKFYRGRSARRIPGTGLGLPICRGIAEAHGGRLWAEHAPGGGVAFVLSLPVGESKPPADAAPGDSNEEEGNTGEGAG